MTQTILFAVIVFVIVTLILVALLLFIKTKLNTHECHECDTHETYGNECDTETLEGSRNV